MHSTPIIAAIVTSGGLFSLPFLAQQSTSTEITTNFFTGAASAIGGSVVGYIVKRFQTRKEILSAITKPLPLKKGHKRNTVMVIGEGGAGKTTLARGLTHLELEQVKRTEVYELYNGTREQKGRVLNLVISDYKGQDLGTLVRAFIVQQLQPNAEMRFGYVNTLLFVVDLFDPKEHENKPEIRFAGYDQARVVHQLALWNRTTLDAIFGMHVVDSTQDRDPKSRRGLRQVILFINKFDLLERQTREMEQKVLEAFKPLATELQRRCCYTNEVTGEITKTVKFDHIIGSLGKGAGLPELLDHLSNNAVPDGEPQI